MSPLLAVSLCFLLLLVAWLNLRATASPGKRRLLWVGVAAAGVAFAASLADALF
jgi:hypothetical protein